MLRLARIHTVVLQVADLDASRAWYAAHGLGTEVLHDDGARLSLRELASGAHLALVEAGPPPVRAAGRVHAVLAVPDAAEARDGLLARGVPVGPLTRRGRIRVFEFCDPDGHRYEVSELTTRH